jgi:hypothetical protein
MVDLVKQLEHYFLSPAWLLDEPWFDASPPVTGLVAVPRVLPGDSTLLPLAGPVCLSISSLGFPLNPESILACVADIVFSDKNYYERNMCLFVVKEIHVLYEIYSFAVSLYRKEAQSTNKIFQKEKN